MKIYVRRRHINAGKVHDGYGCPIALACGEIYGGAWVGYADIETPRGDFSLPPRALRFIARFDSGKPVKPFAFVLK